jgi:hypothetical protein
MMGDIERAARGLCAARGIDPDEMVINNPPNSVQAAIRRTAAWHLAAREIRSYLEVRAAVAAVETGGKSLY